MPVHHCYCKTVITVNLSQFKAKAWVEAPSWSESLFVMNKLWKSRKYFWFFFLQHWLSRHLNDFIERNVIRLYYQQFCKCFFFTHNSNNQRKFSSYIRLSVFIIKFFFPILVVDDIRFVRYGNGLGSVGNSLLIVFSFAILAITNTSISFFT